MKTELLPCPFCGGEEIDISRTYINPFLYPNFSPDEVFVSCISCGIGYTEESETEATKAWNTRVKTQQQIEEDERAEAHDKGEKNG